MSGEYNYDVSNEQGLVRLLISDVGGSDGKSFIFTDAEIQRFLDLKGGPQLAACTALLTIAGNTAQLLKRIKFLELETDGAATAKALRELAAEFKEAEDEDALFEIIAFDADFFSRREIVAQRIAREG